MLQSWKVDAQLEIMNGRYQRRNLLVDEIEIPALLLRNEISGIIQDEFAREMNHLVYGEARRTVVRDVKTMTSVGCIMIV